MNAKPHPQAVTLRLMEASETHSYSGQAHVTTTLAAIVQGLRNLECQPDPFNEFQGPDALFTRLLTVIVGTTEYDAVMGNDVERLNALLAEQVERVATLTRERDEARAHLLGKGRECDSLYHDIQEAARTGVLPAYAYPHEPSTTPTPGAQA